MTIHHNPTERFSWLEMPGEAVEDERMRKLFAKAKETLGFVPNVFLGYTIRPTPHCERFQTQSLLDWMTR